MADRSTTKTSAARVALTDAKLHGDALDSMPSGAHRAVKETSVSGRDHREETMTDRSVLLGGSVLAGTVPDSATPNQTIQAAKSQTTLPHPEQPFGGRIGRTAKNSTPDFPKGIEAPKDAPNVLLIMTDDGALARPQPLAVLFRPLIFKGSPTPDFATIHPHNSALLAEPGSFDNRTQSPFRRQRRHYGNGDRLPRIQLARSQERRFCRRGVEGQWLQHFVVWEDAQCPGLDVQSGWAIRSVARRIGLRIFLRLPWRR